MATLFFIIFWHIWHSTSWFSKCTSWMCLLALSFLLSSNGIELEKKVWIFFPLSNVFWSLKGTLHKIWSGKCVILENHSKNLIHVLEFRALLRPQNSLISAKSLLKQSLSWDLSNLKCHNFKTKLLWVSFTLGFVN